MAKGGEIKSIRKRVDEINALIKLGNENDIEVVDESTTWESPMKFKPLKYSNGVLYVEYQELDLYSYLKGRGTKYETKKFKVTKYDTSSGFEAGESQRNELNDIAKMYRKALRINGITYEDGGMMDDSWDELQLAKENAKRNIDYDDMVKDAMEYAGSEWLNMTKSQKDELISEMYHQRRQYIGSLEDGGEIEEEEEYDYENDLFNNIESLPQDVQNVLKKYQEDWEDTYENCANMQDELEELGYTFDYYLDATPYNLRKMEDGGMMARGGLVQHGLRIGDKIIGGKIIGTTIRVRNENFDEDARIDLETGKRTKLVYDKKTKKYIESKAMGGETFDDKVQSISKSLLERKKVAPSVQKDYGKTYNKQEALDSARRIVGSMVKKSKN